MPTAAGEPPSIRAQKSRQETDKASPKKRKKKEPRQFPTYRKAYRGDTQTEINETDDNKKREDKLLEEIAGCLKHCSRQRLRAVHMSMRQYGNEASRISRKDVMRSLQNNGVEIDDSLLQVIFTKFEDSSRILQLEALYKYLVEAHSKTDRDSVVAERTRNNILPLCDFRQEDVDEDLIWRIQDLLVKSRSYIDLKEMRDAFKQKDSQRSGELDVSVAYQLCSDHQLPVYGALLSNLMKRCGAERSDKLDWPEFLSFLEKGQNSALKACPDLKELSETTNKQTAVEPSILDELSSKAKNTLVNKLRKKASLKRQETAVDSTLMTTRIASDSAKSNADTTPDPAQDVGPKSSSQMTDREITIREEPYIEVQEKESPNKTDSKGTIESVTSGAQVIIDIIPPSKEPTLEIDDEIEDNDDDSLHEAQRNDDDENVKDTSTLVDEIAEIINTIDAEDDLNDNQHAATKKAEETETIAGKQIDQPLSNLNDQDMIDFYDTPREFTAGKELGLSTHKLHMQWVYGYRGNDCRKNIHVLASGEIVYFMSYIAIIFDKQNHTQRHYTEHTDEIKCIDVHSDHMTVATGQFASRKDSSIQAHVRLWRSDTLQTLHILGLGEFQRAVACIAFSSDKDILAAVDNSPEKTLTVWDTVTGEKMGETKLNTDLICDISFCTTDPNKLVVVGKEHVRWWKIDQESRTMNYESQSDYEDHPQPRFVICLTFTDNGDLVTGDSNGTIYVWGGAGNKIINSIKHAHDGPVFTVLHHGGYLISGGRDGIIHCWNARANMEPAVFLQLTPADGGIRMLQVLENSLIVGTTMNAIHVVTLGADGESPLSQAVLDPVLITQGHYDYLRGLAVARSSTGGTFLTAGQDGIVCAFETSACVAVSRMQVKGSQYLCIDVDENGQLVALGTKDGCVHIFDYHYGGQWQELFNQKISKDKIHIIKISPDKKLIAAGCQDAKIYLMACQMDIWECYHTLEGHSEAVTGVDWLDSRPNEMIQLRSTTVSFERRVWDPTTKEAIPEENIAAESQWYTHTCGIDTSTKTAFSSSDAGEIQALDIHAARNLIAISDSKGYLHLCRYLGSENDDSVYSVKTSSTIRTVRFTQGGRHLLTVGGRDSCIIQWEAI